MLMPTSCLPEDLLIDILLRLPVKPLVRFRLVSKSWFALLKSLNFTTTHLNCSANHGYHLLVDGQGAERHTMILISGKALDVAEKIETPEIGDEQNTRFCLHFASISTPGPNTLRWDCVGFGYHLEDYKVVRILCSRDEHPNRAEVEVYSMSTGSWRVVDAVVPCLIRPNYMCSVHVPNAEGSYSVYRKELGVLHESLAIIYYPWRD
ncbi:hypothetical protein FH972_017235 [Carpinus fangiana]|uniref:F-box domain-containing protein n=1 Tax=Carpinus fangiana TaxID=176857 RepID=A0A5N6RIU6_9ROSI|nr:hypothetical protein FH972_017235 [Carpinus fangiana]